MKTRYSINPKSLQKWLVWLVMLGLLSFGMFTRLRIIQQTDFDGLYGQDAFAYYDYGVDVEESIRQLRTPKPMFWPMGYPLVLAGGFIVGGISPHTAQLMSVLAGAFTGIIIFRLVYDYVSKQLHWTYESALITGIVAGLSILLAGQMLQSSVVVMSDAAGIFWSCLSIWSLLRYSWQLEQSTIAYRWLILASIALAMAAITRWIYGLLVIPWAFACLAMWHGRPRWRAILIALIPFVLIVGLQLVHSRSNTSAFYDHSWLKEWDIRHATQSDFVNADGTFHYDQNVLQFYLNPLHDNTYVAANLGSLLLIGSFSLLLNYRQNLNLLILLAGWVGITFVFLVGIPYQNIRFALAFLPPLIIILSIGWGVLLNLSNRLPKLGQLVQILLILSFGASLHASYQTGFAETETIANRKNKDLAAIEWANTQIPEFDAIVYSLNLHLMMQIYAEGFTNRQIYYETEETLVTTLDPTHPTYLLLNAWSINHQWVDKSPELAVRWIMAHYYTRHLGHYGNYHLWRVYPPNAGFEPELIVNDDTLIRDLAYKPNMFRRVKTTHYLFANFH